MSAFIANPDLQLDDIQRVIVEYTIRLAIEKLTLLNAGKQKYSTETLTQNRNQEQSFATTFDVSNNINRVKSNLLEICQQIVYDGSFGKLQGFIVNNESQESIGREFLRNYAANKSTVKYYDQQLPIDQAALKSAEMEMKVQDYLWGEINLNTISQNQMKYRYNKAWETARLDQLRYAIENEEHQNNEEYDHYKMLLGREEEAAKNLIDCYQTKISFLEGYMEYWTGEYERQMENIVTDIHLTQDWINELEKKISGQEKMYIGHQQTIKAFFTKRRRVHCARIIQNWWREQLATRRKAPRPKSPGRGKSHQKNVKDSKNIDNPIGGNDTLPSDKQTVKRKNDPRRKRRD